MKNVIHIIRSTTDPVGGGYLDDEAVASVLNVAAPRSVHQVDARAAK